TGAEVHHLIVVQGTIQSINNSSRYTPVQIDHQVISRIRVERNIPHLTWSLRTHLSSHSLRIVEGHIGRDRPEVRKTMFTTDLNPVRFALSSRLEIARKTEVVKVNLVLDFLLK